MHGIQNCSEPIGQKHLTSIKGLLMRPGGALEFFSHFLNIKSSPLRNANENFHVNCPAFPEYIIAYIVSLVPTTGSGKRFCDYLCSLIRVEIRKLLRTQFEEVNWALRGTRKLQWVCLSSKLIIALTPDRSNSWFVS